MGILRTLRRWCWDWWVPPPRPGALYFNPREVIEIMALKFKVHLPAPGASDVVSRRLVIFRNDDEETVMLTADAREVYIVAEQDVLVGVILCDIDDAGNESESSPMLQFTAKDTIPPPAPGELVLDPSVEELP